MIYVIFSESGFHKTYCSYGTNVCFRIFSRCFGFLNEAIFGITVLLRMFVMTHWNISWFPTAFHICTNNCLICQFERFLCLHLLIRRVAYFDTIKSSKVVWGNLEILSTAQIWKNGLTRYLAAEEPTPGWKWVTRLLWAVFSGKLAKLFWAILYGHRIFIQISLMCSHSAGRFPSVIIKTEILSSNSYVWQCNVTLVTVSPPEYDTPTVSP